VKLTNLFKFQNKVFLKKIKNKSLLETKIIYVWL